MNKDDERRVFDQAYRPHDQWTVESGESPDFVCIRRGTRSLGVEVTELWQHGTDARLSNIRGYFHSLLDGGEVRHKDDLTVAKVESIKLLPKDSDEPIAEVPAIMRPHPSPAERAGLLEKALEGKERRLSEYLGRCERVDLLIDDRSNIFWHTEFEQLIRPISSHPVRDSLVRSGFREVFLLSSSEDGRRTRTPLKASLLMEDLIVLEELLTEDEPKLGELLYSESSSVPAVSALASALGHVSGVPATMCVEEGRLGVSIGCVTLHWTKQGKVIRDYTCMPEQVAIATASSYSTAVTDSIAHRIAERRVGFQATISMELPVSSI